MLGFLKKYKLLIVIVILILIGAAVYQFALVNDEGNLAFLAQDADVSGSIVGNEVVALLNELAAIKISGDVFEDPAFNTLINFQKGVNREPIGRSNPFAPIGSGGGTVGFIELPFEELPGTSPTAP